VKRTLLILLFLCYIPMYGINSIKDIFVLANTLSQDEQIRKAISDSDVSTVLNLVKSDTPAADLQIYYNLAQNNFGHPPRVGFHNRLVGAVKIAMGMALLYKTGDYFKNEWNATKPDLLTRYKSPHHLLMDIACLSGFISSYNSVNSGINNITPRSNYKKQLLIHLYLKSLIKN